MAAARRPSWDLVHDQNTFAAYRVLLSSSYIREIHTPWILPWTLPWTFLETKRSSSSQPVNISRFISRSSSKIFASFVERVRENSQERERIARSIFPYPGNLASFHFCHRCGRGVDRRRENRFHSSSSFFLSFFLSANKNANFETKRINKVDQT